MPEQAFPLVHLAGDGGVWVYSPWRKDMFLSLEVMDVKD